jgi:hypothetical protein
VFVWNSDALFEGDSNVDETGNSEPIGKRVKGEWHTGYHNLSRHIVSITVFANDYGVRDVAKEDASESYWGEVPGRTERNVLGIVEGWLGAEVSGKAETIGVLHQ